MEALVENKPSKNSHFPYKPTIVSTVLIILHYHYFTQVNRQPGFMKDPANVGGIPPFLPGTYRSSRLFLSLLIVNSHAV